ncbi:MAG: dihydroxyacetone kinase subunit L [Caldilinea sp.]|nr:dihydroxyacetone kinase subunit L [Caldilinea sp.]MCB0136035.1 dihydroxyacetone kinase subunit L [Caldilineaceae bacterium]MCB0041630.1 dihydroxyacetone kinase subunit L [Caldilinea sp.]MCB0148344.1 dihydroxyacetone kinase subunit L [Caldilineaceae bacterium]MCB9114174.1 dihydroxyacetone kinase subunit L [Caldilineaceae bacterium]
MIQKSTLIDWITIYAQEISTNKEQLTALDAAIGDADHGINMDRGFTEVMQRMPSLREQDIGSFFKGVGMTLLSKVGGASGPLYGTLFLRMGMASGGKEELSLTELAAQLSAGVDGIRQRGSARPGDKTMIDALAPAIAALQEAADAGQETCQALEAAAAAAEAGMKATIPMQASKGRASYLGPRSIGHQDPGATSAWLLIKAAAQAACSAQ